MDHRNHVAAGAADRQPPHLAEPGASAVVVKPERIVEDLNRTDERERDRVRDEACGVLVGIPLVSPGGAASLSIRQRYCRAGVATTIVAPSRKFSVSPCLKTIPCREFAYASGLAAEFRSTGRERHRRAVRRRATFRGVMVMDGSRFDAATRALGTRRGFVGLLAALATGGVAAREADAKRRRRRCKPACGPEQTCVDRECVCPGGGAVCGANCCLVGQECQDGRCVEFPEPTTCIAYGEPCKGVGRPCCENLVCGSGQGGQADVACYVRKTGRCASTAECVYGTECVDGICVGLPVCNVQLGETCAVGDICCAGACGPVVIVGTREVDQEFRCCAALGAACDVDRDCCSALAPTGRWPRGGYAAECRNHVCSEVSD